MNAKTALLLIGIISVVVLIANPMLAIIGAQYACYGVFLLLALIGAVTVFRYFSR